MTTPDRPRHYSFSVLEAICEQALTSPLNEDGSMRENFVVRPEFYSDVLKLIRSTPGAVYVKNDEDREPIRENYNDSIEDVDNFNRSTGGGVW